MAVSSWKARKQYLEVRGARLAYVEMGTGAPIVFQHGNPTSSYLWREVMPHVAPLGRCIALDLIGMGDSDKLADSGPQRYTLAEHQGYFDAALEALGATSGVTFVLHDWGSALGFDWSRRHPQAVRGLCYMEAIVQCLRWDDWPPAARSIFAAFRSPAGEDMILNKNVFVERVLPKSILRDLTEDEMAVYRAPFAAPGEDRRPTLTWPRQIPLDGEPPAVCAVVDAYARWLAGSTLPKLFINADPGTILCGRQRDFCRTWKNQQEVTVKGLHFIQEDSPHEIGAAIRAWIETRMSAP